MMAEFIGIVEHVATLGTPTRRGYTKQLNWTTVRDYESIQLDLRTWDDQNRPLKGIRLTDREAEDLYEALKGIYERKEKSDE